MKISSIFHDALDLLEYSKSNVFLTGRAGTGKSTLLDLFRRSTNKKVVALAPTGVAALHIGGQTIHSFCGFPPRLVRPDDVYDRKKRKFFQSIDVLIIDEISMVRADLLDMMDLFFRLNRGATETPFGGLQVVLVGDLYQLPPIVSHKKEKEYIESHYQTPYFFSALVLKENFELQMFELNKVYRQEQKHFLRILDEVRTGRADDDTLSHLNSRYQPNDHKRPGIVHLCSTRSAARTRNLIELSRLKNTAQSFTAEISGDFKRSMAPVDEILTVKESAQVMILKNDPNKRYVNGTIGKVKAISKECITLIIEGENENTLEVDLTPKKWEMINYIEDAKEGIVPKVVGTMTQFPIKLAWAITIHKSQGKTFDSVIIDLGRGAFDFGQTYVALSRCKTLEGVHLLKPLNIDDVMVDERVVDYYRRMEM